ncbi:hypothetical protein Clacol_002374 [Clathrus columnatus]|uniref:Uncharacterized protein n=1 Tax=Clathrus columnatus TaxID=1419009 RepID=A0AAV5A6I1_9AGAM|nr:hypothetical protein Clacol_002374 [Clathrus columnatus]
MFSVELLILGEGWTSKFLIPQLKENQISYASTSRSGHNDTLKFEFNPDSHDPTPFQILPTASTILITFPIKNLGGSKLLVDLYLKTHPKAINKMNLAVNFVQLGSSGIFTEPGWSDRHSVYNKADSRAIAEDELLSLSQDSIRTTVLNLSGLWGGERNPRNWITRVASTKELLISKTSLHLIHGVDVARSIIAVHRQFDKAAGSRWILTDRRVIYKRLGVHGVFPRYDWWDLANAWGDGGADSEEVKGPQPQWVGELMNQNGLRALPRSPDILGKSLDSREFWFTFGLEPVKGRVN